MLIVGGQLVSERRRQRVIEACVFGAALLAYGWFHQGGNWEQNASFAQVRAIVEQGTFELDDYLAYLSVDTAEGRRRLVRFNITGGAFTRRDLPHRVTWPGGETPIDPDAPEGRPTALALFAASAEVVYQAPHFYPRQAPGLPLLAAPAYLSLYGIERLAGFDPDEWWVFTVNAWLTTALSVGLVSALGAVLFLRTALALWPGRMREALAATFTFALATIYFPDATMLRQENVVAVALLAGFYLGLPRPAETPGRPLLRKFFAGMSLAAAAACTYAAAFPALLIALFGLRGAESRGKNALALACGALLPALAVLWYQEVCFGSPFRTAFAVPYMMDHDGGSFWTFVQAPQLARMAALLVSPFRGLFFTMPVLLVSCFGFWAMGRERDRRAFVLLVAVLFTVVLVLASTRRDWHGGWTFGPRALVPALPFVALGLVVAYNRARLLTGVLAWAGTAVMLLVAAVDAQPPVGVAGLAARPGRSTFSREPVTEYLAPILLTGSPRGLLLGLVESELAALDERLEREGFTPEQRSIEMEAARIRYGRTVELGNKRLALASHRGPVSANPVGMYEPWTQNLFSYAEPELSWNAFNAGELLFPKSAVSVIPLVLFGGWLVIFALDRARIGWPAAAAGAARAA